MKKENQLNSYLFVSPHKSKVFDKFAAWDKPDCYIFDLQDSCPANLKEDARNNIRTYKNQISSLGCKILLRCNEFSNHSEFLKDMELLELGFIDGVMLPFIQNEEDLVSLDQVLKNIETEQNDVTGKIEIYPLVETIFSLSNLEKILSSSSRISGIALGLFDLFADINVEMNSNNVGFVTKTVMLAAKHANLPFIDCPFTEVHNYAGFFKNLEKSVKNGADAKMILHPDQIEVVNRYFSISEEERERLSSIVDGYTSGCKVRANGKFIGPPLEKMIRKKLARRTIKKVIPKNSIRPRVIKYGLDINSVYENQIITCPYEITMDNSWTTMWSSLVSMSNRIETSDTFGQSAGLKNKLMPFSAVLNLTLCMAVEPYSESCLLHLGLKDVVYENPAYSGDTFRCYIHLLKLRNTSDNERSVITSTHVLVNQHSQRILSFKRNTLFPVIPAIEKKIGHQIQTLKKTDNDLVRLLTDLEDTQIAHHINWNKLPENLCKQEKFRKDELIIHDASRLISESENLSFTTLFRNTHPVHFNHMRYQKDEIIVCGGFVMALVLANALKDFKQVVDQKIISCSHINKIAPNDTISSVSYIQEREIHHDYEVITIKTLGLRNIDPSVELSSHNWPVSLFNKTEMRPAAMESLLKKEMPELFHKVCVQLLWEIWRPIR
jgi:citrate lyase subunit beta/citryl-CoA lyase